MMRLTHHRSFFDPDYPPVGHRTPAQLGLAEDINRRISDGRLPMETLNCLCGGEHFMLLADYDRYRIKQKTVICIDCGLIQSRPRMNATALDWFYGSDAYRRLYSGDDFLNQTAPEFKTFALRKAGLVTALSEHLPASEFSVIAEIGCGAGWNLFGFHEQGRRVIGCDLSPQLTAFGRSMGMDIRHGSVDQLSGEKVDLLILSHVVEHLLDPIAEVRHAVNTVNPRWVYIEVPDADMYSIDSLQSAHNWLFSKFTLRHYMASSGLKAISPISRAPHFAYIFEQREDDHTSDLSAEYKRMSAIIKHVDRRERLRDLLLTLGAGPLLRLRRGRSSLASPS